MEGLLRITLGPEKGRSFPVGQNRRVVVGRSQNADVQLTDPAVSRVHCIVAATGDRITITDSGSISGTWVNGEHAPQRELQPGDVITVGATQMTFQWAHVDESTTTLDGNASDQA